MKKLLLSLSLATCALSASAVDYAQRIDKSQQPRILITTDLEVDDMNGIILGLTYADSYDLAGIVWTAGMFHFSGDGGKHTLGEITPDYRCNATHCEHTVKNAGELRFYRPVDPSWLGRVEEYYEEAYKTLSLNNPNFPTPAYIKSITKVGNIEFEGDYRFETEGSKWIEKCILDDDPRPLYIQHWGGINTTVRALYSIYERYHGTAEWPAILKKVTDKVRIGGNGEDNCRKDSKIDEMFPGLQDGGYVRAFFSYGSFFSASEGPMGAAKELQPYLHAPYTLNAYKRGHGPLMSEIWLFDEGRPIFGEPFIYNYGITNAIDWAKSAEMGWGPENLKSFPRVEFKRYDWMCCQMGTAQFVNIGLRQDLANSNNHYSKVMWDELAARADWMVMTPEKCNHAPIIKTAKNDFTVKPGKTVNLIAEVSDPDGDQMTARWYSCPEVMTYGMPKVKEEAQQRSLGDATPSAFRRQEPPKGKSVAVTQDANNMYAATLKVPKDAKKGDRIVINLEVQDKGKERPMTRFTQYVITVK